MFLNNRIHHYANEIQLFQNPFEVDVLKVPENLQMEVIELQANDSFKNNNTIV